MFNLQIGNKFKLKDFSILYRTTNDVPKTAFNKFECQRHIQSLKKAAPDGEITILKETVDKIFIKEQSNEYPGYLFIYEWMIKEHIAE